MVKGRVVSVLHTRFPHILHPMKGLKNGGEEGEVLAGYLGRTGYHVLLRGK
jgi:hypothetical protein